MSDEQTNADRLGIELPWVYDGISVWQEPDGSYTNRWARIDEVDDGRDASILRERKRLTDEWIDRQEARR